MKTVKRLVVAMTSGAVVLASLLVPSSAIAQASNLEESITLPSALERSEINVQGEVVGSAGEQVSQELILDTGEAVKIIVDWNKDVVSIERESGVYSIPLRELQEFAASVAGSKSQNAMARNPSDINWGSMCQWISGLAGLGHAAIWAMVSPWIGIPYGVFWLWVNMQCK